VIDTELVDIMPGPATPADVAAPPSDAEKTRSGLFSKVLKPGTGTKKPGRRAKVQVNYSGWTTDGRLFDSTMLRGTPAEFTLDKVIPGWTEGVAMMVEGETRRFWIPGKLAYDGKPDAPQGMLVFDIELLAIK
jgi:FKBP-type peptidyl-prolyl cis-trans isomerase